MRKATIAKAKSFEIEINDIASDKSISHRTAIFSILSEGKNIIKNYLKAEDTINTLDIIKLLGAKIEDKGSLIEISSKGINEANDILNCGNSGTTMRLFCGLLAGAKGHFILTGDKYLRNRPMLRIIEPLKNMGARIDARMNGEFAPLAIRGSKLKAFNYKSKISSAQVKTSLILASLFTNEDSFYSENELSRDHTERILKMMGVFIDSKDKIIRIKPIKHPLKPLNIEIPNDPSSAFFFACAAAITPNSFIRLKNLTLNPTRIEAFKILKKMGAKVDFIIKKDDYEAIGDIEVTYAPLKAIDINSKIASLIDEIPAISILMSCAKGISTIKNARELRVKESDRIKSIVSNLKLCNIDVKEFEDGFSVKGGELRSANINSFGDHRIAMSFSIAGIKSGMEIEDISCISTSFPNFFNILNKITETKIENRISK